MAFSEVADLSTDTVIALGGFNKKLKKDNPKTIEGYYLGSKKVQSKKSKTGESYIHVFQTSKGTVGVWGKTDLDRKVLPLTLGVMVRATFTSIQDLADGNSMYKYKVERDNENTIEVLPQGNAPVGMSKASGGYDEDEDDDFNADFANEDEDNSPPVMSAATREANRKNVQALLSKNKKG